MPSLGRTKRLLMLACALLPCACRAASRPEPCAAAITQVTYHEHSGPVADPWSEDYVISVTGIRFERTGEPKRP